MKIRNTLFILLFLYIPLTHSQNKTEYAKIDSLFKKINRLQDEKNNQGITRELINILKIDEFNIQAQSQLVSMIKAYYAELPDELLNESFALVKNQGKLPVVQLLTHYYKMNDVTRCQELILFIVGMNKANVVLDPELLYSIDQNFNPKLYKDILMAIAPFISSNKVSDYIFLNYLLSPDQKITEVIQKLNLRIENLDLCSDSREIVRIRNNYFTNHPNPSELQFELIKKNLTDCINLQDPLWRLIYYYQQNQDEVVLEMINNQEYFKPEYTIDLKILSSLDFTLNPGLAKRIVKTISKFIENKYEQGLLNDEQVLSLVALFYCCKYDNKTMEMYKLNSNLQLKFISLYNFKLYSYLDYLLNQQSLDSTLVQFGIDDISNFDISIDSLYANKVLTVLSNYLSVNSLLNYDDYTLYQFNKICYQNKIYNPKLNQELIDRINPNDNDYKKIGIWGISCILENDEDRANRLFNSVEIYGEQASIDFLNSELKWWADYGLNSKAIEKRIIKNSLQIKEAGLLTTTNSRIENNFIDINSVTENNYYALLIGVENYIKKDMNLKFPLRDLRNLKEVLVSDYTFNENNIITLADPNRSQIYETLNALRKKITINDNLLIFYAGHGNWDANMEQGYWLPSDALPNDKANWISNSEIINLLKGIKSQHTLLIADACFSGSIFITRKAFHEIDKSVELAYSRKSRNGITSGANTPVPDKSIFVEIFIKKLKQNKKKYLLSEELYLEFRDVVTNNSQISQRPLYGELEGDEGGEFIFIRK